MAKNKNFSGGLFTHGKPTALTPLEKCVSSSIEEYLERRKIYNLRLNSGKIFLGNRVLHLCPKGTPDRLAIYRGVPLFIEVKKFNEKPTDDQSKSHELIRASGGNVIVAYSIEDVAIALRSIDAEKSQKTI
jgi:hypothetical protein